MHRFPKGNCQVLKTYSQISIPQGLSKEFLRHSYESIPSNHLVVIHYLGSENATNNLPHGNVKHSTREHVQTCPSILNKLHVKCTESIPSKVYKSLVTRLPAPSHMPVLQPRNTQQIQNVRLRKLQGHRISNNLHEIAINMPSFVYSIKTHPDLMCICGEKTMLDELYRVLLLASPSQQLLSYDTNFYLGDFYVSVLSCQHTLFSASPIIPAAFLIHERKRQGIHEEFLSMCTKLCKSLTSASFSIVTNEERGIVNAVSTTLTRASNERCWNHLLRNVTRWLCSHGATSADISVYVADLRNVFHQGSEDGYRKQWTELAEKWECTIL